MLGGTNIQKRKRFVKIYWITLLVISSFLKFKFLSLLMGKKWAGNHISGYLILNAIRIKHAILDVKGLFIKVGQIISIMGNYLPDEFRKELESLQDQIPPRPVKEIRDRIILELGATPEELFFSFDEQAVASASLAQVHKVVLKNGQTIALKVQHIDIDELAKTDLVAFRRIIKLIGLITGFRGLDWYYIQIREMILEELDFCKEAKNLQLIKHNFSNNPDVVFPELFEEFSTQRILATEFIKGVKINDQQGIKALNLDPDFIAKKLLNIYSHMILHHGNYHADPHPGNIFVLEGGKIAFIDFGATAQLSKEMKQGIPLLIDAGLRNDTKKIIKTLSHMGFLTRDGDEKVLEKFIQYYQDKFYDKLDFETLTLADFTTDFESELNSLFDLRKLGIPIDELVASFQIPKDWVLLQRTMVLLLGVSTELSPGLKPLNIVKPFLKDLVTNKEINWLSTISETAREVSLATISLPLEAKSFLTQTRQGDLEVKVKNINKSAKLIYSLGHQLLFTSLSLGSFTAYHFANTNREDDIAQITLILGLFFSAIALRSFIRGRQLYNSL